MTSKHTPGPWKPFICDDGGRWTGWPLSISAEAEIDKCVVRPGGFYPYEWDASMSQAEAVANAHLIAASPQMLAELKAVRPYAPWPLMQRIDAVIAEAEGKAS